MSVGASGVEVRTESLVALLAGGLAFDTPPFASESEPAAANTVFTLYGDRTAAMKRPMSVARHYVLYFDESLRGLSVGAPVTLLGLPAGEVTVVGLTLDAKKQALRPRVELTFFPERILARLPTKEQVASKSLAGDSGAGAAIRTELLRNAIEQRGLRAQLRSGNLLTGQLYVAVDYFPNAPKVKIDLQPRSDRISYGSRHRAGARGEGEQHTREARQVAVRSDRCRHQEGPRNAQSDAEGHRQGRESLHVEITPEVKSTLEELRRATASADRVLKNTDATLLGKDAPGQQELRDALQEITRAARSLRVLTDYLERHPDALIRGKAEEKP